MPGACKRQGGGEGESCLVCSSCLSRHGQSWAVGKTLVFFKLPAYVTGLQLPSRACCERVSRYNSFGGQCGMWQDKERVKFARLHLGLLQVELP